MINWDDYEENWFADVKKSQQQWLLDKLLNEYQNVDLRNLATELARNPKKDTNQSSKIEDDNYRVLVNRNKNTDSESNDAYLLTFKNSKIGEQENRQSPD